MTPHTSIIWARGCDLLQSTSQTRWHLACGIFRNYASACYGQSSLNCVRLVTLAMRSLRLGHPWNHSVTPNLRIAPRDRAHNRHIGDRRLNDRRDTRASHPSLHRGLPEVPSQEQNQGRERSIALGRPMLAAGARSRDIVGAISYSTSCSVSPAVGGGGPAARLWVSRKVPSWVYTGPQMWWRPKQSAFEPSA
ncbi:hypothetical protein BD413DRAFT_45548 [Trametes elegans]|nr:hypothetical protein BD413DRAFT_45548 [Trametes elegans]